MTQTTLCPERRYICRNVIHNGQNIGLAIVKISGDYASVEPFREETHSTVLVDRLEISMNHENRIIGLEIN